MASVSVVAVEAPKRRGQLAGVQYARAVAALSVLIFHAAQRSGLDFAIGARGVDLFFVISGFIMWTVSIERETTPSAFMIARVKRIVPLYWIATSFLILGALLGAFPTLRQELSWSHVLQSLLFIPHISPGSGEIWPVLVPGWTLNLEMFFYCLFAVCLVMRPAVRLAVLSTSFLFLVAIGVLVRPDNAIGLTYTNPLILEFIAGVWLAVSLRQYPPLPGPFAGAAVVLGIAILAFVPFWGGLQERLSCLFGATLCLLGVVSLDIRRLTPNTPTLRRVGDASYSIYLWHGVAVSIAAMVAQRLDLPPVLIIPASILGGLVLGAVSYYGLERPISRRLSGIGRKSS